MLNGFIWRCRYYFWLVGNYHEVGNFVHDERLELYGDYCATMVRSAFEKTPVKNDFDLGILN